MSRDNAFQSLEAIIIGFYFFYCYNVEQSTFIDEETIGIEG